ncbi:unnamed protein product [Durusdinium trenchii]|uniref:Uncharacterized protein n=1 Tax=Durusdinium trenchii TaxID=1381693 RepID=A0ABP0QGQ9_9DINO
MERGTEWPSCFSECLEQLEEEPKDPEKELQVTAWVHFFKGLETHVRAALSPNRGLFDRSAWPVRCEAVRQHCRETRVANHCCQLRLHLEVFAEFLESHGPFILGERSCSADLYGACTLAPALALLPLELHERVSDWLQRCCSEHRLLRGHREQLMGWVATAKWSQAEVSRFHQAMAQAAKMVRKPTLPRGCCPGVPLEPHVKALPAQGAAGVILQTSNSDLAPDAGANPARPFNVWSRLTSCAWRWVLAFGQSALQTSAAELGLTWEHGDGQTALRRKTWRWFYAGPALDPTDPAFAVGSAIVEAPARSCPVEVTKGLKPSFQFWDVELLHETSDYVALMKPPGHDAYHFAHVVKQKLGLGGRLCHRLETNTSGLQLMAKSSRAFEEYLAQRRQGHVLMQYIALVEGSLGERTSSRRGLIEVPLLPWQDHGGRDLGSICCAKDGLAAGSSYQVLETFEVPAEGPVSFWERSRWFSLVLITTHSDRIYQVYAHLAFIGHPVICDAKYNAVNFEDDSAVAPRPFLHLLRVEVPAKEGDECSGRFCASCELAPDLQVSLMRLKSLAARPIRKSWPSQFPGLAMLLDAPTAPADAVPQRKSAISAAGHEQLLSRCICCGEVEAAKWVERVEVEVEWLHWTLKVSPEEIPEATRPSWGLRGWIPFELRNRDPAHEPNDLPELWRVQGLRWCWAHDGNRVNGWIEFGEKGELSSKWGAGFWRLPKGSGHARFLVVGINTMTHLLELKEDTFEVVMKRTDGAPEDWEAPALRDAENGAAPCCATRGWPAGAKKKLNLRANCAPAAAGAIMCRLLEAFSLSDRLKWLPRTTWLVEGFSLLMTLYFGDIFQQSFYTLLLYSFGVTDRAFLGCQPDIERGSCADATVGFHLQCALFFYTVFVVTIILPPTQNMFTTIVIDAFAAEGDPERYEKIYQAEQGGIDPGM